MEITFHRHPLFFCNIGSRNGKPPKLQWYNSTLLYYILYYMVLQKKRNVKNPTIYHHVSIFQTLTHNSASGSLSIRIFQPRRRGRNRRTARLLFSHELSVDVPFWVKNLWFPENIQREALWIGRFTEFCSPEIQVICELCSTYRRIRKNEQFFILNTQSYDPWRA